jgi:hypothetical protein
VKFSVKYRTPHASPLLTAVSALSGESYLSCNSVQTNYNTRACTFSKKIKDGKNKYIKEIMGVKGKPDIIYIIEKRRLQWYGHVKSTPEERIPKLIFGMGTRGVAKKRMS